MYRQTAGSLAAGPEQTPHATNRVEARGLTMYTRRGVVYEDVNLDLAPGEVAAVTGASGSGRTALLLTLAGRMRFNKGSARVCGHDVARHSGRVRRVVGLAVFPGVNDLDDATSVQTQVRTELRLRHLPHDAQAVRTLLDRYHVQADLAAEIGSIGRGAQTLLGIALGMLDKPKVLMVDEADLNLTTDERQLVWLTLREIAAEDVTVMATCVERPAAGCADVVYDMGGQR